MHAVINVWEIANLLNIFLFFFFTADSVTIHNLNALYYIILQCNWIYELIITEYNIF